MSVCGASPLYALAQLRLGLLRGARALPLAAICGIFRLRLHFGSVKDEELGDPIAHDGVFLQTAVFAAVHLNHAAVVHLSANGAFDLQHVRQLRRELEAAALASLWPVGTDVAEVVRPLLKKLFDTGVLDAERQFELLLEQADVNFFELELGGAGDAGARASGGEFVDDALQLSEDGLHVGLAGLNLNLAELARAVAEENTG